MTPRKPERVPAFQFYPAKWLGSAAVTMMDAAEEGTYIRLLAHQWTLHTAGEGKVLPADPADLKRLTKLDQRQWKAAWRRLEEHFPVSGVGRANPTMEAIWAERLAFTESQRTNGEKGGRPKTVSQPKPMGLLRDPETEPNGNPNESSVVCSLKSELPSLPDGRSGSWRLPDQTPVVAGPVFPSEMGWVEEQKAALKAAALPHEAVALELLTAGLGAAGYAAVGEMHAIATGMHAIRSTTTGRVADATDVMRALAEMVGNGSGWNISYFRGHVRRLVNRAPEPPTTEEREQLRIARAVAAAAPEAPVVYETPEQVATRAAARTEALARFKAEFHRNNPIESVQRATPETPAL